MGNSPRAADRSASFLTKIRQFFRFSGAPLLAYQLPYGPAWLHESASKPFWSGSVRLCKPMAATSSSSKSPAIRQT